MRRVPSDYHRLLPRISIRPRSGLLEAQGTAPLEQSRRPGDHSKVTRLFEMEAPRVSCFNGGTGMNPIPWLQEKTLAALQDAARLVDVAKEPDTTAWYAKTLLASAEALIGRLAPVVALHGVGSEAAGHESWGAISEGGSFALARWCKEWDIPDPRVAGLGVIADAWDLEDRLEKDDTVTQELLPADTERGIRVKLELFSQMAFRMATGDLSPGEQRLLSWLLYHLRLSSYADVSQVSKRFLPTDLGLSREETADAYHGLNGRGLIERIEHQDDQDTDNLAIRLVSSETASKHPLPYRAEVFGFEGSRIRGLPTIGQSFLVRIPEASGTALARWLSAAPVFDDLRVALQEAVGSERVFIETVRPRPQGEAPTLAVQLRYPIDDDAAPLKADIERELGRLVQELVIHHPSGV